MARLTLPFLQQPMLTGLARNHAFADGNKRAAFMVMMTFLRKNAVAFAPSPSSATEMIVDLAAGRADEGLLIDWIVAHQPAGGAGET